MEAFRFRSANFSESENAAIPDAYVDPADLARIKRLVEFGTEEASVFATTQKERTSKARREAKERKFGK